VKQASLNVTPVLRPDRCISQPDTVASYQAAILLPSFRQATRGAIAIRPISEVHQLTE
jgi:hypothetical protein